MPAKKTGIPPNCFKLTKTQETPKRKNPAPNKKAKKNPRLPWKNKNAAPKKGNSQKEKGAKPKTQSAPAKNVAVKGAKLLIFTRVFHQKRVNAAGVGA